MLRHDPFAERQLLSACLTSRDKCGQIISEIDIDDFYDGAHGQIYSAVSEVFSMTGDSTVATVRAKLIERGHENNIALLMDLMNEQPLIHVKPCLDSVKALTKRRKIDFICDVKAKETTDPDELAGELVNSLIELAQPKRKQIATAKEVIDTEIINKEGYLSSVPWINSNIKGFKRGNFVIMGARPHTGKTVNAIDMARVTAKDYNTLFFTLESPRDQVMRMLLMQISGVSTDAIQSDLLSGYERDALDAKKAYASNLKLKIVDRVRDIGKICNIVRSESMDRQIDYVYIDYIQRVYAANKKQDYRLQIGEVCKTLKDLAEDTRSCIIAPSQLNRGSDSEEEPGLVDLKESGNLEEDADVVILFWPVKKGEKNIRAKCAKNRNNGTFFKTELYFDKKYLQFRDTPVNIDFNNTHKGEL